MAASYPVSVKSFLTYQNQPGDANHIINDPANPGQTIDLTIDRAKVMNEIHDEVIAIEQTVGVGTRSMGLSIQDLFNNKSPGHANPVTGVVPPVPPPSHEHVHEQMSSMNADDHPQYMRVDGVRGFSAPVTAPDAWWAGHLVTLEQAQGAGLNSGQVEQVIQNTLASASSFPMTGQSPGRWKLAGGYYYGPSNVSGAIFIDFGPAQFSGLLTFVWMKCPFPGRSMLGWYNYQYMEDQLILLSISNQGAWIQFIEDIVVDRQALVSLSWMALGV